MVGSLDTLQCPSQPRIAHERSRREGCNIDPDTFRGRRANLSRSWSTGQRTETRITSGEPRSDYVLPDLRSQNCRMAAVWKDVLVVCKQHVTKTPHPCWLWGNPRQLPHVEPLTSTLL